MARTRAIMALCLLLAIGCGSLPQTSRTGAVREIRIGDEISPSEILAFAGDEIRFVNLRPVPVYLGFLGSKVLKDVSCENGFSDFGLMQDLVTIPPQQAASLCFASPGNIHYNVWLEADNFTRNMSRTALIRVRGS